MASLLEIVSHFLAGPGWQILPGIVFGASGYGLWRFHVARREKKAAALVLDLEDAQKWSRLEALHAIERGRILDQLGSYAAAEIYYRNAVDIMRESFDGDDPDLGLAQGSLASNLIRQEQYEEAEPLYRSMLDLDAEIMGVDDPGLAFGHESLADILKHLGRDEDAKQEQLRAVALATISLGDDHPDTEAMMRRLVVDFA